jgi:hypothetical protein
MSPDERRARLAFVVWQVSAVVWVTWLPFLGRPDSGQALLIWPRSVIDGVGNLLLLVPVAIGLRRLLGRPAGDRAPWLALAGALDVGVLCELGQIRIATRVVSPLDPLINAVGAAIGLVVYEWLERHGRFPSWGPAAMVLAAWGTVLGVALSGALDVRLDGWDYRFEVRGGDEVGGSRAYPGSVSDARICAGQLEICATPREEPLGRARLVQFAERSQRVVLEAIVEPQRVPEEVVSIVTFSGGTAERNVTLGQFRDALVLRVRTPRTGPNGVSDFSLLDAVRVGERREVGASYDRRTFTLWSRGERGERRAVYRIGLLNGWFLSNKQRWIHVAGARRATVATAMILFAPFGWVAMRAFGGRPSALLFVGLGAPLVLLAADGFAPPSGEHLGLASAALASLAGGLAAIRSPSSR